MGDDLPKLSIEDDFALQAGLDRNVQSHNKSFLTDRFKLVTTRDSDQSHGSIAAF